MKIKLKPSVFLGSLAKSVPKARNFNCKGKLDSFLKVFEVMGEDVKKEVLEEIWVGGKQPQHFQDSVFLY